MTEIERISDQLKRAFEGGAWHGPSVKEVLEGVTAEKAAARPISGAHSIWELVLHIAVWEDAVKRWVRGETHNVTNELDWQKVKDTNEAAWKKTLENLETGHMELRATISRLSDGELDKILKEPKPSVYDLLHGVIQHDLYHAGQIAVLKKRAK
ncbi:MAG: DinB family protein [candidate division Zixibacteria bacterium]|nr:DinB family protein [candidate division Zixibacteria bacterium]